jgi:hypothetical protein
VNLARGVFTRAVDTNNICYQLAGAVQPLLTADF